jgi:translation initiation factor 3 subunit H
MESLIACVNDLVTEQQNVSMYHKNVGRQQQQVAAWLQKRRQENLARKAAGEEPLPEEDPALFKPIPEPSQLDSYLITNQIGTYCDQINTAATQSLQKMYVMQGLLNGMV